MKRLAAAAALSLVAFAGCTSGVFAGDVVEQAASAELVVLQDILSQGARAEATFFVENGRYSFDPNELGLSVPEGVAIAITEKSPDGFCLTGTHESISDTVWHISSDEAAPAEGPC